MKKIDKLVVSKFIGPFILTFFITLFIIVMQFLWKYIDDMVGKGLEWYLVAELIFYASASFVPLALPLAVLLSSIMTFGSFGENYELVAAKSSGISLIRFMASLIIGVGIISIGAFFFSNYILPQANLKFGTLLYDIRHQKPALNIKEGVFYTEIEGVSIKVGKKDQDNKTIHDIIIYDHSNGRGNDNVLIAQTGEMFTSEDGRYLILKLIEGKQYSEMKPNAGGVHTYDHLRTYFDEWERIFDLSEFSMKRTDEKFWKNHYQMLNLRLLNSAIDTLDMEISSRKKNFGNNLIQYFTFKKINLDSLVGDRPVIENEKFIFAFDTLSSKAKHKKVKRALSISRSVKSFAGVAQRDVVYRERNLIKHKLAWHRKFTFSVACMVLFFIGAPLGAIVRIGGLGLPMIISVSFFVIFHVFSMMGQKIAEEARLTPFEGSWLATFVLLPMGIFITYKAMRESSLFNVDIKRSIDTISKLFRKKINS